MPSGGRLVLCESILDAAWFPDRVALGGTTISKDQLSVLHEMVRELRIKEVVVMLDGDAAGRSGNIRVATSVAMAISMPIYYCECPQGQDPCELGNSGAIYMLRNMRRFT